MEEKLRQIKMLLMDVDGVMTDGRFFYLDNGIEGKAFDVKDGFALRIAAKTGLKTGIITGKMSPIVERRAKELDIDEFHQGFFNKVGVYNEIKKRQGLFDAEIAYIGDDLFDLGVLKLVGFSACPANAVPEVRKIVDYVCECDGGRGAVREIIEMILKSKHKWGILVDKFIEGNTF